MPIFALTKNLEIYFSLKLKLNFMANNLFFLVCSVLTFANKNVQIISMAQTHEDLQNIEKDIAMYTPDRANHYCYNTNGVVNKVFISRIKNNSKADLRPPPEEDDGCQE